MTIEEKLFGYEFNGEIAKQVRVSVYPNLTDFVKELNDRIGEKSNGLKPIRWAVGRYENKIVSIRPASKGKIIKVYLEWLKEHGYNPFDR